MAPDVRGGPSVAPPRDVGDVSPQSRDGCTAESGPARDAASSEGDFHLSLFGWNVGGCDISDLAAAVRQASSRVLAPGALLALQELPRAGAGWATEKQGLMQIVSYRAEHAWRGAGVAFHTEEWAVVKRVAAGRGVWIQLKHLKEGCAVWVGSVHLTPGATHAQSEQEMSDFMRGSPKVSIPAVCQCDANAAIRWGLHEGELLPVGTDGKANEVLSQLGGARFRMVAPGQSQLTTPTSRPRQAGRRGHIIDYLSVRGIARAKMFVHVDSHMVLGTDHELLEGTLSLRRGTPTRRFSSKPRVWIGGIDKVEYLDQQELVKLARRCTKVARGSAYQDPLVVKDAVRQARLLRSKEAWCRVRGLRKHARKQWEKDRLARASHGDWMALRGCRPPRHTGWEHAFAEAQDGDPHTVVHNHLESVYKGDGVQPNAEVFPGETKGFTLEELRVALGQMKNGKSVGVDGTSAELLKAMADLPGGADHLLELMTRTLVTHEVPPDWNVPLMIILAKVATPSEAKHLRPISMGSAAGKLFSRMLLNRTMPHVLARTHCQCAGVGRQSSDYLYTVWRVLMLEREWHSGVCMLKLDIAKAFDSVDREQLLRKLQSRMGDCSEMRCWRALLQDCEAVLQSPWSTSLIGMTRGIKQGAVESPALFAMVAEVCLEEAAQRFRWGSLGEVFPGMPYQDVLFMDDCILWMLAGERVVACSEMEVMGLPMRVGMTASELIAPLVARARDKFWSLQHVFRSRTSLRGRLRTLATVVGNSALWPLAAFPPDRPAMGLMNTMQLQITIWTMRVAKRRDEGWDAFRLRAYRGARAALHASGTERWSTEWLRRWWRYAGHRSRCLLREFPPLSAHLEAFRTLDWWRQQQRDPHGLRHPRHYPRLANLERDMHKAAQGDWRVCAQDREGWRRLEQGWVNSMDLPWASGKQTRIQDWQ
ncbi:putative 149 kDa protein [Symbiodinium microadriaticum]|uniref:Putative 149 kDa protein n=1 Tax=Symbiodinium microadriaticum TaxID=2951 RepID=A0A1Q9DZ90_SYMMI|nr:putative 149 kDa protein [Symbiodinium microadriaticum]